jgi:hypothetical protein
MSVFDMNKTEFQKALAEKTTPEQLFLNAKEVYNYLSILFGEDCRDSVLREWAFQWWTDVTLDKYETIYNEWLKEQ